MKTIKFIDSKTINIKEETITQKIRSQTWKGHTIGNIPNEFYSYFNYKGLTYIQE
jgi:hypothetical protein